MSGAEWCQPQGSLVGTLPGPASSAVPCYPAACTASRGKPQPRHWDLDHKAMQKKQFQKGRKTRNVIYAVIWQVLKPTSIALFLLYASEFGGRTSPCSPRVACSFTLLVRSHLARTGLHLGARSSRAAVHLGSGQLQQQAAQAGMARAGRAPACLTSETIFEARCCISNYYGVFAHMCRV